MLTTEVLSDAGFRVIEFSNAADAVAFCQDPDNELAAVFTDINMPGDLDELDVAQRSRRPGRMRPSLSPRGAMI